MRHWFVGDGVIVRYDDNNAVRVRVRPIGSGDERRYRCSWLNTDGGEAQFTEWSELHNALIHGVELLP